MIDPRRFTMMWGLSGRLNKRFKESAGLEQDIRKQLAGLRYE